MGGFFLPKMEIFKPNHKENIDHDVPEFGGYALSDLKVPEMRKGRPNAVISSPQDALYESAIQRALYFGYGIGDVPHVHFPNAEHFQHIPFTKRHWEIYGNMEGEHARLRFMMGNYPERLFPKEWERFLCNILLGDNVLNDINYLGKISLTGNTNYVYKKAVSEMFDKKELDRSGYKNDEVDVYQSDPVFYEVDPSSSQKQLSLWNRALGDLASLGSKEDYRLLNFLEFYGQIKDPITPITNRTEIQGAIFMELYKEVMRELRPQRIIHERQKALISQLALESSFLSLLVDIKAVVYGDYHELPYILVDPAKLPRGEFANPKRVLEVLDEILVDSKQFGKPVLTPITASFYQEPSSPEPQLFIVDGNNRSTAVLLMKFFKYAGYDRSNIFDKNKLLNFVDDLHLDIEWERDLAVTLNILDSDHLDRLLCDQPILEKFADAKIPALLVQEQNFHTIAVAQSSGSKIKLLQPMHQAIYNQSRYPMAIPSKQQSHGRSAGNDIRFSLE